MHTSCQPSYHITPPGFHQRHGETHAAGEDASTPKARNGPPNNESDRVGRGAADGRADLEEPDGDEEDALDTEETVQLSEAELERAVGKQVGGAIPPDVRHGVEVIRDLGDRSRDNQSVLRCEAVSKAALVAERALSSRSPSILFFSWEHRVVITYECHEEH